MTTKPPTQTPFDDEISLLDIIQFFKTNIRRILLFVMMGGILGGLYGKFADPIYEGSMLIAPAKVAGNFVNDPKVILTKLNMNSYYSKEAFLACNPMFYKDKDKDIVYDMSGIVKTAISKDGSLISVAITGSHRETIIDCLNVIENDIKLSQLIIAEPLIEMKKNDIQVAQNKLKISEDTRQKLNFKRRKELKTTEIRLLTDVLYANIMLSITSEITTLMDKINQMTADLSLEQTKGAGKALPINMERKSFPSLKLGLLLGGILGGILGSFVSIFRHMKID